MSEVVATIVGQNQPPAGESEGGSIDFGALRQQASDLIDKADVTPVVEATPAADPTKVRVKGAAEAGQGAKQPEVPTGTPSVEEAAKAALEIGDDTLVKVLVDGEEEILPWKEARGKISGGLKFTKNMQTLAKDREAFETERGSLAQLQQEREAYRTLLSDPAALRHFMEVRFPQPPAANAAENAQGDPNEIATVGQARTIAEAQAAQFQKSIDDTKRALDDRIKEATAEIEFRQQTSKHAVAIQSTLSDIFTKNPVLNAIPNAEDLIRYNVAQLKPQTEEAALEAFRQVSQAMVEEIGKHYKADKKVQAVAEAKQRLESKSIEPVAGAGPQIEPTNFKNSDGTVNWKKVQQAASDYLG